MGTSFLNLLLLCVLCSFKISSGVELHSLQISSVLPSSVCSPSITHHQQGSNKKGSLKVIHKHGACSDNINSPTHAQILQQDQSRVNSILSKFSKINELTKIKGSKSATLPAKSGATVGSGNYVVTVGLGTPAKQLSLIFDTGSDLTWTQCQPCLKSCYQQKEPTFDPSLSSSYSNISCNVATCTDLTSATGNTPGCAASTCVYGIQYGDQSFSVGFFGKETLTLTSTDAVTNFLFGCGQNNQGLFGGSAGLLGLGQNKISLVSQTAQKYGKYFSYCLPSTSSSTGHLTFGKSGKASRNIKFSPLSSLTQGTSFYGVDVTGMSTGGVKLSIPASVFSNAGAIIDSGTVITRLPPTVYSSLKASFRKLMTKYPLTQALSILDTCYDFSNYSTITIPKISIYLSGGVEMAIDSSGILYANGLSQVCLAFAANGDDTDVAIIGNVQQKTLEVVYDVQGERVGFGVGGCS